MARTNASKAIAEARVGELLAILLDGAQSWDAFQFVREKEKEPESVWHVPEDATPLSDAMIRKYVTRAYKLMDGAFEKSRGKLLRRHVAKLHHLYGRATTSGELSVARAVLRDLGDIFGFHKQKVVHSGKVELTATETMSDEDLLRIAARGRDYPSGSGNGIAPT